MAAVLDAGADLVARAGWRNAGWRDADGEPVDILAGFRNGAANGLIDRPIWIKRESGLPLALRLVAVRPRRKRRRSRGARRGLAASKGRHQISKGTLAAGIE